MVFHVFSKRFERLIHIHMREYNFGAYLFFSWLSGYFWLVESIFTRGTTNQKHYQIWVVKRHQHGISVLVSQMSFGMETAGSIAKCWLSSPVAIFNKSEWNLKVTRSPRQQVLQKLCFQPWSTVNNKFIGIQETASSTYNVQPSDMGGDERFLRVGNVRCGTNIQLWPFLHYIKLINGFTLDRRFADCFSSSLTLLILKWPFS